MKFSNLVEAKAFFQDLTGATKDVARKGSRNKFFTFREYTDAEVKQWGKRATEGKRWEIVDNATPNYKDIFPISEMVNYSGTDRTPQIEAKYALADIAKGKWAPYVNESDDLTESTAKDLEYLEDMIGVTEGGVDQVMWNWFEDNLGDSGIYAGDATPEDYLEVMTDKQIKTLANFIKKYYTKHLKKELKKGK